MDTEPQELGPLAKLVIVLAIVLIIAGAFLHGLTYDTFARFWDDLIDRPSGPMRFRFVLQPLMATIAAFRSGIKDAHLGRAPFLETMLRDPTRRVRRLNEALNTTARIILLGLAMDVIYQAVVFKTFYPNEALVVALLLAFVPYMIIRGLVTRVWRRRAPTGTGG
jgi:hypothetical protein